MAVFLFSGTIWSLALWFLFSVVGFYVLTYYLVYFRQTKRWEESNIPFLQPTFLIGHKYLKNSSKYSIAVPVDQIYKENSDKDVIAFFMGVLPAILIKNPKLIQLVFSQNFGLPQGNFYSWILREGGVVMSSEEMERLSRSLMAQFLSANWYQGARFEFIKEEINELRRTAEKVELDGAPINVGEVTVRALKNIGGSTFGIDSHSVEMKNRLWTIVEEFFEASHRRSLMFFSVYFFPSFQVFDSFKVWSRKSANIMSEIITHQIKLRDQNNTEPRDFIDILQSLRMKEESNNINHKEPDVLHINRGVLAKMTTIGIGALVAGSDGVEKLFAFSIHTLSLHPECQCKIRSEIHEALKKHGVSELNFDVVRSLSYVNDCLKETARLYPMTPIITKAISDDYQIPGTKYTLRKGDTVILPYYSGNRDERNFNDPNSFHPERFTLKDANKVVPEILLSFGIGAMKCPGYTQGLFTISALVASLVQKYEIKPRSHLKLMDSTDFLPEGILTQPRRDLLVDLVRCEKFSDP